MDKEIYEMAEKLSDDYCEQYDDGQGRWCDRDCEVCRAERLYNAGYRKIDQTYEQLQDENERLHKRKDYLEAFIVEKGWQEYVGEENKKTVWHKVEDGDLPKEPYCYYCYYAGKNYSGYRIMFWDGKSFITEYAGNVIAWTTLPKYEGEEKCHTK